MFEGGNAEKKKKWTLRRHMLLLDLHDDALCEVLCMLSPLAAMPIKCTARRPCLLVRMAFPPVRVKAGDDLVARLNCAREGETLLLERYRYAVSVTDIVVRRPLRIQGIDGGSQVWLMQGARIVWCATGLLCGVEVLRECTPTQNVYPNAALCVRGQGRLRAVGCIVRYAHDPVVIFHYHVVHGIHVDFGAVCWADHVRIVATPGACIKVHGARMVAHRCAFLLPQQGPCVLAVRGFVSLRSCTFLHRTEPAVCSRQGASVTASTTQGKVVAIRRV